VEQRQAKQVSTGKSIQQLDMARFIKFEQENAGRAQNNRRKQKQVIHSSIANHLHLSRNKKPATWCGLEPIELFHHQHLPGAFDGTVKPALIMRGQTGVLARQDSALVGHELPQQVDVFKIERICREIDFGFGPRRAHFHERSAAPTTAVRLVRASFARHKLFDFAMERVAAQGRIVLP
jgi:hypothetical protein